MAKRPSLTKDLATALASESGKAGPVPEQEDQRPNVPPSRRGKITFAVHVTPKVRAQMKALAVERGTTVQALMAEGMNYVFKKYGKPQIA
jgi:hypothetical protein